jgi:DNA-directed RNA polymerase specialized sigma24 family protein
MTHDWISARFREALCDMVRRRVPARDVEDIVQSVLAEALGSAQRPSDPDAARRWVWGIARHKIVDYHRHAGRESFTQIEVGHETADVESRDLLRWAEDELPSSTDAQKTFEWLLREGDGEKLEDIARSQALPAAQVRQRVSRLRKHFRQRWALYAAALGAVLVLLYFARRRTSGPERIDVPHLSPSPETLDAMQRAARIRRDALTACSESRWAACVEQLDAARALDPAGDDAPAIRAAREHAQHEIEREEQSPPPSPAPVATPDVIDPPATTDSLGTVSTDSLSGSQPRRARRHRAPASSSSAPPSYDWSGSGS